MGIDHQLLIWLNQQIADPGLDLLFAWLSSRVFFALPLLLFLLLYCWRLSGSQGVRLWLLLIIGLVMGDMLGNLLKDYFAQPRPCFDLYELLRPPGGGDPRQCHAPVTGMPSNHALNSMYVAVFIAHSVRRLGLSLWLLLASIAVGVSRIYLAKHYPYQVLSGWLVGGIFGYVFAWLGARAFDLGSPVVRGQGRQPMFPVFAWASGAFDRMLLGGRSQDHQPGIKEPLVWLPPLVALLLGIAVWMTGSNQLVFTALNQLGPLTSDALWAGLTLLGDTLVAFVLLGLIAHRRPDIFGALLLAALFATAYVHVLKPLFDIARPLAVLGEDAVHVIGVELRRHAFPSGHTTTATVLAAVITLRGVNKHIMTAVLMLGLLAGLSRAAVGAHWPLDILAGIFGGWISAWLGVRIAAGINWSPGNGLWIANHVFFIGVSFALIFGGDLGYPEAAGFRVAIGLVGLIANLTWLYRLLKPSVLAPAPHHPG